MDARGLPAQPRKPLNFRPLKVIPGLIENSLAMVGGSSLLSSYLLYERREVWLNDQACTRAAGVVHCVDVPVACRPQQLGRHRRTCGSPRRGEGCNQGDRREGRVRSKGSRLARADLGRHEGRQRHPSSVSPSTARRRSVCAIAETMRSAPGEPRPTVSSGSRRDRRSHVGVTTRAGRKSMDPQRVQFFLAKGVVHQDPVDHQVPSRSRSIR